MANKPLRLGIVGCGGSMGKNHSEGIAALNGDVVLVAACDIVIERAQEYAKHFEGQDIFVTADYKELVGKVDAVLLVLPHDLHYEAGIFFARNKIHILMEKPLCNTESECKELIKITEEEGVTLMCAYPVRHWPGILKLKEITESGKYGKVINMSIWTEQLTELKETDWGATARLGGGQFFSHGCHYIDLLMWFLGDPERGSHFGSRIGTPWLREEGTSNVIMKFKNGAMAYHFGTWGARGTKMSYEFQILFEEAMVSYSHEDGTVRVYKGEKTTDYEIIWKREGERSKETQFEIEHFAECIRENKKPITDGETSLRGLKVIWAMYNAEKNNIVADLSNI